MTTPPRRRRPPADPAPVVEPAPAGEPRRGVLDAGAGTHGDELASTAGPASSTAVTKRAAAAGRSTAARDAPSAASGPGSAGGVPAQRGPTDEPAADGPADVVAAGGLSERDAAIIDFERQWWRHAGSKEQAIRDTFQLSPTRYYQLLNALLDNPAALLHDATVVNRLRRLRAARQRARAGR